MGEVVGTRRINIDITYAFIWSNGVLTDLPPAQFGGANGINNLSQVIGYDSYGTSWVVQWQNRRQTILTNYSFDQAQGYAINDAGQVAAAGLHWTDWIHHTLFIDPVHNVRRMMSVNADAIPAAINGRGDIVGTANNAPYLWSNGVVKRLSQLLPAGSGWTLTTVTGINDQGWIVGYASC